MAITDWPADERPREKLLQFGAGTLSNAELLAVFLRVGVSGKSAVDLGRELLGRFGSLTRLFAAGLPEISRTKGVGQGKFVQLQAAVELMRRALAEELALPDALESPRAVRDYLRVCLANKPYEVFMCLFLDVRHRVLAAEELFRGTLTHTSVYPREVAQRALRHNAASVVLAHNHPSGSPAPSEADLVMTRSLGETLALIDVRVLDHFIIAGSTAYSFSEHGQL